MISAKYPLSVSTFEITWDGTVWYTVYVCVEYLMLVHKTISISREKKINKYLLSGLHFELRTMVPMVNWGCNEKW